MFTEAMGMGGGQTPILTVPVFCDLTQNGDFTSTEFARCLQGRYSKGASKNYGGSSGVVMPLILGNVNPSGKGMNGNVFDSCGLAPTLTTNKGEGNKIAIPVLTPDRENKRQNGRRFKEDGEPMFTLTSQDRHGVMIQVSEDVTVYAVWVEKYNCYMAIRKLTPLECFRLQGFPDDYFYRAQEVNSDSQLYKQAGNSVSVPVIYEIAKHMDLEAQTAEEAM